MVWAVFGVGQFLESFFITPKIVGDPQSVCRLSWVIFSLMAFGQLWVFGMLAVCRLRRYVVVLLREGASAYFGSHFYKHK